MQKVRVTAKTVLVSAFRIEVEIDEGSEKKVLFFKSDVPFWEDAPLNDDYIAVALCHYCSNKKLDLFIDGSVTESVLRNLDEHIKIWSVWRPDLYSQVRIEARNAATDSPRRDKPAVMAFSGGLDACFSLAAHQAKWEGDPGRSIMLGILIVGFDIKEKEQSTIRLAYKSAKRILGAFGAGCAMIATNWQTDFCPDWRMGCDVGLACVLHTLADGYSRGIISADDSFLEELRDDPYSCNMTTNHLLGSYTFPVLLTGGTHTRLEKAGFACKYPVFLNNLRVCWQRLESGTNCGVCEKCVRTRLEMMVYGVEPDIFNQPMEERQIEQLDFKSEETFGYFEEIYMNFPKDNRYYNVIQKIYLEKKDSFNGIKKLTDEIIAKNREIKSIKDELNVLRNLKSYKITKPLRAFENEYNTIFCLKKD